MPVALVVAIVLTTSDVCFLVRSFGTEAVSLAARSVVTASRVWPAADSVGVWLSFAVVEAVSLTVSELAAEVVACSETFVVLSWC